VIGANGKNASVPCSCPPSAADFLTALTADILAGHAVNNPTVKVTFPTGSSIADAQGRISAASVTLQNLAGPGKGCPIVATTLQAQSKALDALAAQGATVAPANTDATAPPPPAASSSASSAVAANTATAAAAAPPASSGLPTAAQIAQLAPDLGVSGPLPPTGAGDCKGPTLNAAGQPISVPCSCPPSRADFIAALTADVLAGHAVHNPAVAVTFPTGDSVQDQLGRIGAASVTLQNLDGPGKGCPFVSTTLPAQSKALQAKA
jgi:Fe-S cluster biogenesis protein NfuA